MKIILTIFRVIILTLALFSSPAKAENLSHLNEDRLDKTLSIPPPLIPPDFLSSWKYTLNDPIEPRGMYLALGLLYELVIHDSYAVVTHSEAWNLYRQAMRNWVADVNKKNPSLDVENKSRQLTKLLENPSQNHNLIIEEYKNLLDQIGHKELSKKVDIYQKTVQNNPKSSIMAYSNLTKEYAATLKDLKFSPAKSALSDLSTHNNNSNLNDSDKIKGILASYSDYLKHYNSVIKSPDLTQADARKIPSIPKTTLTPDTTLESIDLVTSLNQLVQSGGSPARSCIVDKYSPKEYSPVQLPKSRVEPNLTMEQQFADRLNSALNAPIQWKPYYEKWNKTTKRGSGNITQMATPMFESFEDAAEIAEDLYKNGINVIEFGVTQAGNGFRVWVEPPSEKISKRKLLTLNQENDQTHYANIRKGPLFAGYLKYIKQQNPSYGDQIHDLMAILLAHQRAERFVDELDRDPIHIKRKETLQSQIAELKRKNPQGPTSQSLIRAQIRPTSRGAKNISPLTLSTVVSRQTWTKQKLLPQMPRVTAQTESSAAPVSNMSGSRNALPSILTPTTTPTTRVSALGATSHGPPSEESGIKEIIDLAIAADSDYAKSKDRLDQSKDMNSIDALLHYDYLTKDLPTKHHFARNIPDFTAMSVQVTDEVAEQFRNGKEVVTFVVGSGGHFITLAVKSTGEVTAINSQTGSNYFTSTTIKDSPGFESGVVPGDYETEANKLIKALNKKKFIINGKSIKFGPIKEIAADQQKNTLTFKDRNCLIFSLLNARQIAKTGKVESHQEVTNALGSGRLTYTNIHRIGSDQSLMQSINPSKMQPKNYEKFMQEFRNKSQEIIDRVASSSDHLP